METVESIKSLISPNKIRILFVLAFSVFYFSTGAINRPGIAQGTKKAGTEEYKQNLNIMAAPPVVVTAPTVIETVGSTFVLPITVSDITGDGIISFQFNIIYDPEVIDPTGSNFGCSTAGTLSGNAGMGATCNVLPDGVLRVTVSGPFSMTGSGTVLNLTFTTDATAIAGDISPLTFENVFFFNGSGLFASTPVNGQVTLTMPTSAETIITGQARNQAEKPLANIRVFLTAPNGTIRMALTNPFGYFRFFDVQAGESYLISAQSRRYTFAPQLVSVGDEVTSLALISDQ